MKTLFLILLLLSTEAFGQSTSTTSVYGGSSAIFVGSSDFTAQSATITNAALVTSLPATGRYRVNGCVTVTRAATTSSSITVTITYTDPDTNTSMTVTVGGLSSTGTVITTPTNATGATGTMSFTRMINAKAGTNITYTATYASSGATAMQYSSHLNCEAL